MKKFIFITTLTPESLLTPLRKSLFLLYIEALKNQTYDCWEALLFGEKEEQEGNIKFIKTNAVSKTEKLQVAYEYLLNLEQKPDYIIRLDDDDIISPYVLEFAAKVNFDCFSDLYHTYYNITSGYTSQQKRSWLPNTIIHKYEHAIAPYGEHQLALFQQDHSQAWHRYYAGKKIVFASANNPVYMRIISPTTITSTINQGSADAYEKIDFNEYENYLKKFGKWRSFNCKDFEMYYSKLIIIWESFSNQKIKKDNYFLRLKKFMRF